MTRWRGLLSLWAMLWLCVAGAAWAQGDARPPADQRFVVVHKPGPAWRPQTPLFQQPGLDKHVAHYRQWQQQGKLSLGGPFMDSGFGGMMITEPGLNEDEVKAFAAADPAVHSGLLTYEVRRWLVGMKRSP